MSKYLSHGKLTAVTGKADELEAILLQAAELVKEVAGCNIYVISRDKASADDIWATELWDSKDDHDVSLQDEKVRTLISTAMPLIAVPPTQGQELVAVGGVGY
jgi:quinol monooxygenase YgiN